MELRNGGTLTPMLAVCYDIIVTFLTFAAVSMIIL